MLWTIVKTCSNPEFLLELWKNNQKPDFQGNWCEHYFFVVLWYGRSCQEVRRKIFWAGELNTATITQSRNVMPWWPPICRRIGSVGELSTVCSQSVLKCVYLARIGRPDILWSVNRFARVVTKWNKACDKRVARLISYIRHTCEFRQHCPVGKHNTTMQTWLISRLWFCRRPWRLKINIGRNSMLCRKSHVCANKLDVQETDISLTQFNRGWDYFSWRRFTHGWNFRSWSLGLSDWSISFPTQPSKQCQRSCRVTEELVAEHNAQHAKRNSNQTHQSRSD